MKMFMILAVISVAVSLQAGAAVRNDVSRYNTRAALLAPCAIAQTHATAMVAAGGLSGQSAVLGSRPGLVVASARALNADRYSTKAGFRGIAPAEIALAPLK
jgi:NO-binding membrane sensor protein with MHYT domain